MKKIITISFLSIFMLGLISSSCKSSKNSVDKRIHKKRKKAGSQDCPMKDC